MSSQFKLVSTGAQKFRISGGAADIHYLQEHSTALVEEAEEIEGGGRRDNMAAIARRRVYMSQQPTDLLIKLPALSWAYHRSSIAYKVKTENLQEGSTLRSLSS